jgi:hypothetical protein
LYNECDEYRSCISPHSPVAVARSRNAMPPGAALWDGLVRNLNH